MFPTDFYAYEASAHPQIVNINLAIQEANQKAVFGRFIVCITTANHVLVLPEFNANQRMDILERVYDTDLGYLFHQPEI